MELNFIHKFVPAESEDEERVLLMLHGTGGSEEDLVSMGKTLVPGAAILSPRGNVSEDGMARFFRRISEGVFDIKDVMLRADELAKFIQSAAIHYGLNPAMFIAVGYSNGANIAAALLLLKPSVLHAAVLFRPMVPMVPDVLPDLRGKPVLVAAGRYDEVVCCEGSDHLAGLLEQCNADVTLHWEEIGHELTDGDIRAAREWLGSAKLAVG